jgi:glycerophosphoryl diester phosphodiesterase
MTSHVITLAHRGLYNKFPENTLEAFKEVFNECRDMRTNRWVGVEFDIMLTKDKQIICFHDTHTGKLMNDDMRIAGTLYTDLLKLKFNDIKFDDVKIPLLKDVLEYFRDNGCIGSVLNIEVKSNDFTHNEINRVLNMINKYNVKDKVIITSFNHHYIAQIKTFDPEIKVGLLFNDENLHVLYKSSKFYNDMTDYIVIKAKHIKVIQSIITGRKLRQEHLERIICYKIPNVKTANQLVACGVSILILEPREFNGF